MDALEQALSVAAAGALQVVLVEGEAGVGKSSLMRTFRNQHQALTSLAWTGDETELDLSFAMLDQLIDGGRAWADPYAAGAALLGRLDEIATTGPVLVALDDAHLADPPSLVALNFAFRRLVHDPVLLVLSARSNRVADAALLDRAHGRRT